MALPVPPGLPARGLPAPDATETDRLLRLCAAQIDGALGEFDAAMSELLDAFTTIVADAQALQQDPGTSDAARRIDRLADKSNAAIRAMQFHDRLTQRLGHVRLSLLSLGEVVTDPARSANPDAWHELLERLGRLYRTREEVAIFAAMTAGVTAAGTLRGEPPASQDIELF